jgi:hypothetical protein
MRPSLSLSVSLVLFARRPDHASDVFYCSPAGRACVCPFHQGAGGVPTQHNSTTNLRSAPSFFLLSLPLACVCACRPQVARSRIAAKQPRAAVVVDPATDIPASGTFVGSQQRCDLAAAACWGQLVRASWVTGSQNYLASYPQCGEEGFQRLMAGPLHCAMIMCRHRCGALHGACH